MQLILDDNDIEVKIDAAVERRLAQKKLIGRTITIDEFRKEYCGGKAKEWVRQKIFDRYPEVDADNGGWVVNPRVNSGGRKTIIFAQEASEWMQEHQHYIDWNERVDI